MANATPNAAAGSPTEFVIGVYDSKHNPRAGLYTGTDDEVRRLRESTGMLAINSRCNDVSKRAFNEWGVLPSGHPETIKVCALHPEASFNPKRPASPCSFYIYDRQAAAFKKQEGGRDVDIRDEQLLTLKQVHEKAYTDAAIALTKHQSPVSMLQTPITYATASQNNRNAERAFKNFQTVDRNLRATLQRREELVKSHDSLDSAFFTEIQDYAIDATADSLFARVLPTTLPPVEGESPTNALRRCKKNYEILAKFFKDRKSYTPNSVQEKFLGAAAFALSDALKECPESKISLFENPADYLDFCKLVRQYSRPKSTAEFRKELVHYLFRSDDLEPSEAFKRSVQGNSRQKAKLEEMIQLKQEIYGKPGFEAKKILRSIFRETILGVHRAKKHFIDDLLLNNRMHSAVDIIRKSVGQGGSWFPNLPEDDLLSDADDELAMLLKLQEGSSYGEAKAKTLAEEELAKRLAANGLFAFNTTCVQTRSLEVCLLHAAKVPQNIPDPFDHTSSFLQAASSDLKAKVYPRLDRLGSLHFDHPKPGLTARIGKSPDTVIYQNFNELQEKVGKQIFPALENFAGLLEAAANPVDGVIDNRYMTLLDDIELLRTLIPKNSIPRPGISAAEFNYPRLADQTAALEERLTQLEITVRGRIAQAREEAGVLDYAAITPAERAAPGMAPTTAELTAYATTIQEALKALRGTPELMESLRAKASDLEEAIAAGLPHIAKILPADHRAELMRHLFEALFTLQECIKNNPGDEALIKDNIHLATEAAYALADAIPAEWRPRDL